MDRLKNHLRRDPKYRGHVQAMDAVEAGDYKSAMKYGMYVDTSPPSPPPPPSLPSARTARHMVLRARCPRFQASEARQAS